MHETIMPNIVLIGAGRLATQFALNLASRRLKIRAIYSHTLTSALLLKESILENYSNEDSNNEKNGEHSGECPNYHKIIITNHLEDIPLDASHYIYALKDEALEEVVSKLPPMPGLHLHTSGSISCAVFKNYQRRYGVFYPFQTFSKTKFVAFEKIPIFIEGSSPLELKAIEDFAHLFSPLVYPMSSEDRKIIHLSGVFACNFTNYLWTISTQLLKTKDLPFSILMPLIEETIDKLRTQSAQEAQTGPAARGDQNIIDQQLKLLKDHPDYQDIYQQLTAGIQNNTSKL